VTGLCEYGIGNVLILQILKSHWFDDCHDCALIRLLLTLFTRLASIVSSSKGVHLFISLLAKNQNGALSPFFHDAVRSWIEHPSSPKYLEWSIDLSRGFTFSCWIDVEPHSKKIT
jgi:hypothetical protein